jgi:hypothetical protein
MTAFLTFVPDLAPLSQLMDTQREIATLQAALKEADAAVQQELRRRFGDELDRHFVATGFPDADLKTINDPRGPLYVRGQRRPTTKWDGAPQHSPEARLDIFRAALQDSSLDDLAVSRLWHTAQLSLPAKTWKALTPKGQARFSEIRQVKYGPWNISVSDKNDSAPTTTDDE